MVQPVTGDTFALTVDANNAYSGVVAGCVRGDRVELCGESDWVWGAAGFGAAGMPGSGSAVIAGGDYSLALSAVATGSGASADTLLFVGTEDLYRCSLAAGCALRNTTNAANGCAAPAMVSPAEHAIAVMATGSLPLLYVGNDGGMWRSTDGVNQQQTPCSVDDATHFQNLNGGLGSLAEVVSFFAEHPTDESTCCWWAWARMGLLRLPLLRRRRRGRRSLRGRVVRLRSTISTAELVCVDCGECGSAVLLARECVRGDGFCGCADDWVCAGGG